MSSRGGSPDTEGPYLREVRFSEQDRQAHINWSREEAVRQEDVFPELVARLMGLFRRVYPAQLIAVIASWGFAHSSGPAGISETGLLPGIEQHHIELLQALLLTLPDDQWGELPAETEDFELAVETIKQLATAFHRRTLSTGLPVSIAMDGAS